MVLQLRNQAEAHRKDLENVTQQFAEGEKNQKRSHRKISALRSERKRLRNEVRELSERYDREKKLTEAVWKRESVQFKEDCEERVREVEMRVNDEKQRLVSWVKKEFRGLCDIEESFGEESFPSVLGKIRNEMNKLIDGDVAVRRLVGAAYGQSTEEAVARFVLR
jgi:chromosome segregation ATPase